MLSHFNPFQVVSFDPLYPVEVKNIVDDGMWHDLHVLRSNLFLGEKIPLTQKVELLHFNNFRIPNGNILNKVS